MADEQHRGGQAQRKRLFKTREEVAAVQAEREAQARRQAHEGCQILVRNAKASSPMVRHLLAAIKAKGCHMPPGFLRCEPCGLQDERSAVAGGFVYEPGNEAVVICSETATPELTRRTLVHELIHAYDLCRVHMKPENLYHRACTEVRAANLSTDCKFSVELRRGVVGLAGHHRACVKRRAVQSIRGAAQAANKDPEDIVDSVFERCYRDTSPFPGVP